MHAIAALEVNIQTIGGSARYHDRTSGYHVTVWPMCFGKNISQIIWLPLHTLYHLSPDVPENFVSLMMNRSLYPFQTCTQRLKYLQSL